MRGADPTRVTVGELRSMLDGYPVDTLVALSGDAEGNSIRWIAEVSPSMAIDDGSWEIDHTGPTPEEIAAKPVFFGPEDDLSDEPGAMRILIVWPVN